LGHSDRSTTGGRLGFLDAAADHRNSVHAAALAQSGLVARPHAIARDDDADERGSTIPM